MFNRVDVDSYRSLVSQLQQVMKEAITHQYPDILETGYKSLCLLNACVGKEVLDLLKGVISNSKDDTMKLASSGIMTEEYCKLFSKGRSMDEEFIAALEELLSKPDSEFKSLYLKCLLNYVKRSPKEVTQEFRNVLRSHLPSDTAGLRTEIGSRLVELWATTIDQDALDKITIREHKITRLDQPLDGNTKVTYYE